MNLRAFSAALREMDRSNWPVHPAAAEQAMFRYYQMCGREKPCIWVDSPNETGVRKHQRPQNSYDVPTLIERLHHWRFPPLPDDFWRVNDAEAADELNLRDSYPTPDRSRWGEALEAMLDAYVAGAFAVIEYASVAYVISRPVMYVDDRGRLHHERKPAVAWYGGPYGYRLHGVEVEEHIITRSKPITMGDIGQLDNAEVRRVVIERFGWRKYLKALRAYVIDEDPVHGTLWEAAAPPGDLDRGRMMRMLELKDPSTDRKYFIRVPANRSNALSARAWTFSKTVQEFEAIGKET